MLRRPMGSGTEITYECDDCGESLETDLRDLALAQVILKDEGWKVRNHGGKWKHYCEDCADGY